jgi:hypothetical protein
VPSHAHKGEDGDEECSGACGEAVLQDQEARDKEQGEGELGAEGEEELGKLSGAEQRTGEEGKGEKGSCEEEHGFAYSGSGRLGEWCLQLAPPSPACGRGNEGEGF